MKIIRYQDSGGQTFYGAEQENGIFELDGNPFDGLRATQTKADVRKILAPVEPASIICIGLNYRHHAAESGNPIPDVPVVFFKGINAVQNPGDPILIPTHLPSNEVDYECELAMVIGKKGKNIPREKALDYVLGFTCANDVSARDWQMRRSGGQWCRAKSFDTFAPLGPRLVTTDEIGDPQSLRIATRLNGETVQDWNTDDMIFDIPTLIEFLSGSTTLLPGTVILTGTPHGVGVARKPQLWMKPGDLVEVEIEKIGILKNPIRAEV